MVSMLKWWFIFFCSAAIVAAMTVFGTLGRLWELDVYKACFVTMTAYFSLSGLMGWLTWKSLQDSKLSFSGRAICLDADPMYGFRGIIGYAPDLMTQLGLIGTVIGFIMMMASFVVSADPAALQSASVHLTAAATVALANTLCGLCCSVLMKFQTLNLEVAAGDE